MANIRTPARSNLRIADLKQRILSATQLMNVKVPSSIADRIAEIAARMGANKTEVIVALLNAGLDVAKGHKQKRS